MTTGHITKTGRKTIKKGVTTEGRREEVKQLFAELEKWKAAQSVDIIAEVTAKHDGYSPNNALLIAMQRPTATDVDAYGAWSERNRMPVGSSTGIKIVAPAGKWLEPNPKDPANPIEHVQYKIRYVYDVSTTIERTGRGETADVELAQQWRLAHPEGWGVKDADGNIIY
jgi:hypothetical protein